MKTRENKNKEVAAWNGKSPSAVYNSYIHKCLLEPSIDVEWIGKALHHRNVSNTGQRTRQPVGPLCWYCLK
jgi:hypothetical protein